MYRNELPRIYELRDLLPDSIPANAYFQNLDTSLLNSPLKLRYYRDLEQDLAGLDAAAWAFLRSEVKPLLLDRYQNRGWQPLFDKLNQAKGYNHLKAAKFQTVSFVQPVLGRKTPDLEARDGARYALCEVKTVNVSEVEAQRRILGGVGRVSDELESGFFKKLSSDLAKAQKQLAAFDADSTAKKLAYVVINFDDSLHEYADRYREQIERYMACHPTPDLEVVFYWKPPFRSAEI